MIAQIDSYHGKIGGKYAIIDETMMAERNEANNDFVAKANVTSEEIEAIVTELEEAFSTAKVKVVIQKIEEIGEVELTDENKAKIDDAREYYDSLSDEEKQLVSNKTTLATAEEDYTTLKHDHDVRLVLTILGIVICSILLLLAIIWLILFFGFRRYVIVDNQIKWVCILSKDDKVCTVMSLKFKTFKVEAEKVFKTKEEAEEELSKKK